jgi:putative transposase
MRVSRFSVDQIMDILRQHDDGVLAAELCRRHGISEPTFYRWKQKYSGLNVSEAERLQDLQEVNDVRDGELPRR